MNTLQVSDWSPFAGIDDDELLDLIYIHKCDLDRLYEMKFNQFPNDNDNIDQHVIDLDPDYNFFLQNNYNRDECNYYFCDDFLKIDNSIKQNNFSIINLNINSVPRNFDNFRNQLLQSLDHEFDIISLCETKLDDNLLGLFKVDNYVNFNVNNRRNSGGLAMYVKNIYSDAFKRDDLSICNISTESLFVELPMKNSKNILCGVIYHRPGSNKQFFLENLELILSI